MLVKIKTWEEMANEFGFDAWGDIDCECSFTNRMEAELPPNRIINIDAQYFWWEDGSYDISDDMIEQYLDKSYTIYGELINVS